MLHSSLKNSIGQHYFWEVVDTLFEMFQDVGPTKPR